MTRPLRSSSDVAGGYTRLERTILSALAADLGATVPDLARQIAASRPGRRRNTGFGLFTDLVVQTPAPRSGPTGDFGTVHAMVGPLRDPIAFTVRLQDGRLIGLVGDSYGQDTRALDFATVPFDQVFTVDASGHSIPFRPATPLPPPPGEGDREATGWERLDDTRAPPRQPAPPPSASRRIQETADQPTPANPPGDTSVQPAADGVILLLGAWAAIAVIALFSVVLFDVPWPFALIAAVWLSAALRKPKARDALQRGFTEYQKARAAQQG